MPLYLRERSLSYPAFSVLLKLHLAQGLEIMRVQTQCPHGTRGDKNILHVDIYISSRGIEMYEWRIVYPTGIVYNFKK